MTNWAALDCWWITRATDSLSRSGSRIAPRKQGGEDICLQVISVNHQPVVSVQGSINLVKEVERSRITSLDGEDEGERHKGLLAAT